VVGVNIKLSRRSLFRRFYPFIRIFLTDFGKIENQRSSAPSHDSDLWTIKSLVDKDNNTDGQ